MFPTGHVGDHFEHRHLDDFWHLWINIFAYGSKIGYQAMTGHFHLSYSPTRWWSKFDCIEQTAVGWAMIMPTLLERIIARSTSRHSSASC